MLELISLIRNSFEGAEEVYTRGSCIQFALILEHVFPGGRIHYNQDHAVYEYEGKFYDITGEVEPVDCPLSHYGEKNIHYFLQLKAKVNVK